MTLAGPTSSCLRRPARRRPRPRRRRLDPPDNASDVLGASTEVPGSTELLADPKRGGGAPLHETLTGSAWSNVEPVPANSRVDADLGPTQPLRLRNAFAAGSQPSPSPTSSLLDCLPSLGRLLMAELLATTDLLVVTEPGPHTAQSACHIEETVAELRVGCG